MRIIYCRNTYLLQILVLAISINPVLGNELVGSIKTKNMPMSEMAGLAKISFQEVLKIVQNSFSGRIIEIALEKENDYLVYEVEVISKNVRREILIDAGNGAVLSVEDQPIRPKKSGL